MPAEVTEAAAVNRTIESLRSVLVLMPGRLAAISSEGAGEKPSSGVWSRKEELGHLIDSATNNHQRIVRAQVESGLALPGYDGDRWVELHRYQQREWRDLICLWRELNKQLLAAAESVPHDAWSHALTIGDSEVMTLGFVFVDYLRHMSHHLRHIGVDMDDLAGGARSSLYPEKPAPAARPINDLLAMRWSPRAMEEGRPVEREKLLTMLEAARWAPSSYNDQPRFFLVFDGSDPVALEKARACLVPGNAWALKAPVLLLSVARETFEYNGKPNRHGQHDTGLATENLLLEAVEVGLIAHAMAGFDADRAIQEFGIPVGHTPMAMIAVGYPYRGSVDVLDEKMKKGEKALRDRKPVEQMAFGGAWNKPY